MQTNNKKRSGMLTANQANKELNHIMAMRDSRKKYDRLSGFLFKVAPYCYEWNKAREESKSLAAAGIEFRSKP